MEMDLLAKSFFWLFEWIVNSTYYASIIICLIIPIQALILKKVSAQWTYWLWIILLIRLLLPLAPESHFSFFNLTPQPPYQANTFLHNYDFQQHNTGGANGSSVNSIKDNTNHILQNQPSRTERDYLPFTTTSGQRHLNIIFGSSE